MKASVAWNRRLELAPPHAHGWGPEPDSNLSLSLEEWTGFLETARRGPHGTWGMQMEGLVVATSGWEFLLPSHRRLRWSVLGEKTIGRHQLGLRADLVGTEQVGSSQSRCMMPTARLWGLDRTSRGNAAPDSRRHGVVAGQC